MKPLNLFDKLLHASAKNGHLSLLKLLSKGRKTLGAREVRIVQTAAVNGHLPIVKFIFEKSPYSDAPLSLIKFVAEVGINEIQDNKTYYRVADYGQMKVFQYLNEYIVSAQH